MWSNVGEYVDRNLPSIAIEDCDMNNDYNFEKAITYHFWHNTTNTVLATLSEIGNSTDTGNQSPAMVTFRLPLLKISY